LVAGSKKLAPAPKFWDWLSLVVNGSLNVWTVGATLFTVIVVVAVALAPKAVGDHDLDRGRRQAVTIRVVERRANS